MGQLPISISNGSGAGAVPKSGVKDPDLARLPDAIAVAKVALHDLRHGRAALESGLATKKFKSLMVAGINRLNRSISELEGQLEELLV
jgi:hypothetical protein